MKFLSDIAKALFEPSDVTGFFARAQYREVVVIRGLNLLSPWRAAFILRYNVKWHGTNGGRYGMRCLALMLRVLQPILFKYFFFLFGISVIDSPSPDIYNEATVIKWHKCPKSCQLALGVSTD